MYEVFRPHLSQITSIRVGHSQPPSKAKLPLADFTPLYNLKLVNFHCATYCFEPKELVKMFGACNSRLRSLKLGWDGAHIFPFDGFPSLEHLSLFVVPSLRDCDRVRRETVAPSLKTFFVDNLWWFVTTVYGEITFPNLRAFSLQELDLPHFELFDFISVHPSLLEVDLPNTDISFPDFVGLAQGERKDFFSRAPCPSLADIQGFSALSLSALARLDGLTLSGFFFTRSRHLENCTHPILPHRLTELGIQTSLDSTLLLEDVGLLGGFPLFSECTKLSLVISSAEEDPSFATDSTTFAALGRSLAKWKKLRHLHLSCAFPTDFVLPVDENGHIRNFENYCHTELVHLQCVEEFRQDCIDCELEYKDEDCVIQFWREMHEWEMRYCLRDIVPACPALEVFEWSMHSEFDDTQDPEWHPPLWRSRIHRNSDGSARVISSQLTWNGHPNHPLSMRDKRFNRYRTS
ncbi:hypothetical protein R3P38DRAFT_2824744 [Favolaschia claudopus]|uniref:Uncharacterized protein n=1 Tax=Favolaschia claudopus TaxID=2862362 RepID=A0AAW0EIA5_9AGAR